MSGPLSDASARLTVSTRLLKSLNVRLIFTFGYFAMNCFVSSLMHGHQARILVVVRPDVQLDRAERLEAVGLHRRLGRGRRARPVRPSCPTRPARPPSSRCRYPSPGVPPQAATTSATSSASSAAIVPLLIPIPPPPFTDGGRAWRGNGTGPTGSASGPARRAGRWDRTLPFPRPARARPCRIPSSAPSRSGAGRASTVYAARTGGKPVSSSSVVQRCGREVGRQRARDARQREPGRVDRDGHLVQEPQPLQLHQVRRPARRRTSRPPRWWPAAPRAAARAPWPADRGGRRAR